MTSQPVLDLPHGFVIVPKLVKTVVLVVLQAPRYREPARADPCRSPAAGQPSQ